MTESNHEWAHDYIQRNIDLTYQNVNIAGIHMESENAHFIWSHFRSVLAVPKVVDRLFVRERQLSRVPNTNILYRRTEHCQRTFLFSGWGCQYPKENNYSNIPLLFWITIQAVQVSRQLTNPT